MMVSKPSPFCRSKKQAHVISSIHHGFKERTQEISADLGGAQKIQWTTLLQDVPEM